jgi:hypothetical protein
MADDRMMQRLEEQLRDSHATNAELRERLADADRRAGKDQARVAEANAAIDQLERANAKRKAAETSRRRRPVGARTQSARQRSCAEKTTNFARGSNELSERPTNWPS